MQIQRFFSHLRADWRCHSAGEKLANDDDICCGPLEREAEDNPPNGSHVCRLLMTPIRTRERAYHQPFVTFSIQSDLLCNVSQLSNSWVENFNDTFKKDSKCQAATSPKSQRRSMRFCSTMFTKLLFPIEDPVERSAGIFHAFRVSIGFSIVSRCTYLS